MILTLIIGAAVFAFIWWLIGYGAPPDLVKPLRILAAIAFLVWLLNHLGYV